MGRRNSHNDRPGVIGVLAKTRAQASSLARELNILGPIPISPVGLSALRGNSLTVLLVDEDMWPVPEKLMRQIEPSLQRYGAYVLQLTRHDPCRALTAEGMRSRPWAM